MWNQCSRSRGTITTLQSTRKTAELVGHRHHGDDGRRRTGTHVPGGGLLHSPSLGTFQGLYWVCPSPPHRARHHRVERAGRREPAASSRSRFCWAHARGHTHAHELSTPGQFPCLCFRLFAGNGRRQEEGPRGGPRPTRVPGPVLRTTREPQRGVSPSQVTE